MANDESTAVNELIALTQPHQPVPDPAEELFRLPPHIDATGAAAARPTGEAGRVPTPNLRASLVDVAPLPRTRAPHGTERGTPTLSAAPAPAPVRMTTAPPSRATTIPSIGRQSRPVLPPPIRDRSARPAPPPPALRARAVTLPPPRIEPADSTVRTSVNLNDAFNAPMRTTLLGQSAVPPARPTPPPPPALPVVAPFMTKSPTQGYAGGSPATAIDPWDSPSTGIAIPQFPPDRSTTLPSNQAWFDHAFAPEVEYDIGTARVPKLSEWQTLVPKLIVPMVLLIIAGVFVAGFFAFDGDGGQKPKPAIADARPVAAPANLAVEPAIPQPIDAMGRAAPGRVPTPGLLASHVEPATTEPEPIQIEPTPSVTLVDIRIDSTPVGATVMIVDRGKTAFLGATPISTAVDASRQYDLVFTYANKPTQLEHLNPSTTKRIAVVLGKPGNQAAIAAAPPRCGRRRRRRSLRSQRPSPRWSSLRSSRASSPNRSNPNRSSRSSSPSPRARAC